ncbi:MAG: glycosyltransferase [Bryobacterales bacterium]|nr:glycosyltransferase [Bryobacterales bacterium]
MSGEFLFCRRAPSGTVVYELLAEHLSRTAGRLTLSGDCAEQIPDEGGAVWVHGNAAFFPKLFRRLKRLPRQRRPFVVIWHNEPLPPPRASGLAYPMPHAREIAKILLRDPRATDVYTNWFTLRELHRQALPDVLVVSAPGRHAFLSERGIPSHFVPLGYAAEMGRDLGLERDIDVLFLGALDVPRRNRILKSLRGQGVNVTAVGDWKNPAYWGENRTALLNRAKILLNVPRTAGEYSGLRILLGMANKALVISEPIWDPAPYVPGRHFLMAPVDEMAGLVRRYLTDETARAAVVDEAYRTAIGEFTMERSVERILQIVASRGPRGAWAERSRVCQNQS